MTANITRKVLVVYTIDGFDYRRKTVQITEGYTTEADIPKILAVLHFSDNKQADRIGILFTETIATV